MKNAVLPSTDERPAKQARLQRTKWVFTAFSSPESIRQNLQSAVSNGRVVYSICQLERAPSTERLHVQGYLELKRSADFRACQRLIGDDTAHLEPLRGTRSQAREYCRKEETREPEGGPWEFGQWREEREEGTARGARSDLHGVASAILEQGLDADTVAKTFPTEYLKYHRGVRELVAVRDRGLNRGAGRNVTVEIFVGGSGKGKTRRALYENPGSFILDTQAKGDTVWWDGYNGQKTVIIDEFSGQLPYRYLLQLLDPFPALTRLQVKGGYVPAEFTKVVVTSNKMPDIWYNPEKVGEYEGGPLERRVVQGTFIYFYEEWVPPNDESSS